MDKRNNEYGAILEVLKDELKYYVPYAGQVLINIDPMNQGMIQCSVPELGWNSQDEAAWCSPEFPVNASNIPAIGSWVKVYFMGGDRDKPYYGPKLGGFLNNNPMNFPKSVIFENAFNTGSITWDDLTQTMEIKGLGKLVFDMLMIEVNGNTEYFTLYTALNTALQTFITLLNNHVHTSAAPGSPTTIPVAPMSLDISLAQSITLTTGG